MILCRACDALHFCLYFLAIVGAFCSFSPEKKGKGVLNLEKNFNSQDAFDSHIPEKYEELTSFKALRYFVRRDYEKINGKLKLSGVIKSLLFEPGFKYVFWLRLTRYYHLKSKLFLPLFVLCRFILKHYSYKYEFDISYRIPIGPGLSIAHIGYCVVAATEIGSNCFLRPGVVMGKNLLKGGRPSVGDNVHIGVGAKIIGDIHVGNNVIIGANAVVTKDVPSNTVVGGNPAKVLKTLDFTIEHGKIGK